MPSINALNTPTLPTFAPTSRVAPVAVSASNQLAAIDAKYPNLDADLAQAQADVASTAGSDSWSGLKWYEKAVFFIPPFGPLIGVMLMGSNKDMIRQAENTLEKLEGIAALKADLQAEVAANRPDRFGR